MNQRISAILENIRRLEADLEKEIEEEFEAARERLDYQIEQGKVRFKQSAINAHRELRKTLYRFLREATWPHILTAPIIYSLIVPLILLDLLLNLYQIFCFPVYGIKKVPRSRFIVVDRHKLAYLNPLEKINCIYCGYGNGLLSWGKEVAARTEEYWCPIKHSRRIYKPHSRYSNFLEYGDASAYRELMKKYKSGKGNKPDR